MMTEQEMRVAIAEACGWGPDHHFNESTHWHKGIWLARTAEELPDYLNDLNAIHEAEEVIYSSHMTYVRYETILIDMVEHPLRATAKQRATAFCMTLYPERFKE